jgi:hypothetical protein
VQQLDVLRVIASEVVKERVSRDKGNLLIRLGFLDHSTLVRIGSIECLGNSPFQFGTSAQVGTWFGGHVQVDLADWGNRSCCKDVLWIRSSQFRQRS